jgi:eukaryotic-like serine/threonine-protein kinase
MRGMTLIALAVEQRRESRFGNMVAGKYRLGRLLDREGTVDAYLAVNENLDLQVIVKLFQPDRANTQKFQDEASQAAKVKHPSIASVLDAGVAGEGEMYVVMEHPRGVRLKKFIAARRPLPVERIVGIMEQVLGAIAEVHHHGLTHGDIQTDNVLIETNHDGADVVKLIDFGPNGPAEPDRGPSPGTAAADLHHAGVVLNELLTGHMLPTALDPVVLRALCQDPAERYQSAGQMLDDVLAALLPPKEGPDSHSDLDRWLVKTLKDVPAPVDGAA